MEKQNEVLKQLVTYGNPFHYVLPNRTLYVVEVSLSDMNWIQSNFETQYIGTSLENHLNVYEVLNTEYNDKLFIGAK